MLRQRKGVFLRLVLSYLAAMGMHPALALATPLGRGRTTLLSTAQSGAQSNGDSLSSAISADARYVAFESTASDLVEGEGKAAGVFLKDRQSNTIAGVSIATSQVWADGFSENPSLSANGRLVVFDSWATNLSPGDS